ncbi:MAG TPA: D-alanine--D-alanine ligase family protein [Solirubrobacteraceae bacterium]|nr:D-alanine--D-alanine ligase family protein [Solirubrobacteraceae bacterium]
MTPVQPIDERERRMAADAAPGEPLTVGVLAGGRSGEHDVSLSSGAAVRDGLRSAGHEVVWVEIARDGVWRCDGESLSLSPGGGLLGVDVVFPVLHGPFGEDGTVQGLLETLDVAYVGAGVAASAVCLDKVLFKQLMSTLGVPQVDYAGVRAERFEREREQVLAGLDVLGMPVFVKPAHLGSSVGIVKVSAEEELAVALEQAFVHDELAIVEAMASGTEVECAILGALPSSLSPDRRLAGPPARSHAVAPVPGPARAFVSEPGEIVFPGEFYDFAAKYSPGGMELRIPAGISPGAREQVRRLALSAFEAVGCEGLARVDFFVDGASISDDDASPHRPRGGEGERVLVNELNTMPGFTPTSVYAKLMDASGVPYPSLLERLCRLGLERHERRRALVT